MKLSIAKKNFLAMQQENYIRSFNIEICNENKIVDNDYLI